MPAPGTTQPNPANTTTESKMVDAFIRFSTNVKTGSVGFSLLGGQTTTTGVLVSTRAKIRGLVALQQTARLGETYVADLISTDDNVTFLALSSPTPKLVQNANREIVTRNASVFNKLINVLTKNNEFPKSGSSTDPWPTGDLGKDLGNDPLTKKDTPGKSRTLIDSIKRNSKYNPPTIEDDGFFIDHKVWYLMVRNALQNVNSLNVGPTGTGKTEGLKLLAKRMEKNLVVKRMNTMSDPETALLGSHRMEDKSVFDYASFVHEVQMDNTWILFEEISRASPQANNILFSVLDKEKVVPIDIADSKHTRLVEVNPKTVFFGNANRGAAYTGTNKLDKALINRFFLIEWDYMSEEMETLLLTKVVSLDKKEAEKIAKLAAIIRTKEKEEELSEGLSHRNTIEWARLVKDGYDFVEASELVLYPIFEGTNTEGDRAVIHSLVQAF